MLSTVYTVKITVCVSLLRYTTRVQLKLLVEIRKMENLTLNSR